MATYDLEHVESEDPHVTVVALAGELDLTNADELAERLDELRDAPALVLDLNRVVFIDSAALHCLFRLGRERQSLALALEPASPIATTLAIAELGRVAPIAASVEEAKRTVATTTPPP